MIVIGIVLRDDLDNARKMHINREVCEAISIHGGFPIGIYPKYDNINDIMKLCDGFILQGGTDFTDYDISLLSEIYKQDKPLLGICLGMQTIASFFNGNVQKCLGKRHNQTNKYVHNVKIIHNSLLYKILHKDKIMVNSRHNDCVKYTSINISAISDDGVIEAVEIPKRKFFLGVQWHPESLDDINSYLLFKTFIDSCREE